MCASQRQAVLQFASPSSACGSCCGTLSSSAQQGLTPRSRGDPLRRGSLAAQPPWFIIGRTARAPRRRARLTSNVRPRMNALNEAAAAIRCARSIQASRNLRTIGGLRSQAKPALAGATLRRVAPRGQSVVPPQAAEGAKLSGRHGRTSQAAAPLSRGRSTSKRCTLHPGSSQLCWCKELRLTKPVHINQPRPNTSLEPTRSGMAPRPRSAVVHDAPRGQGAMPARAAQLKRSAIVEKGLHNDFIPWWLSMWCRALRNDI